MKPTCASCIVSFAAPLTVPATVYIIVFATPPKRGFATRALEMLGTMANAGVESRKRTSAAPTAKRERRTRRDECMGVPRGIGGVRRRHDAVIRGSSATLPRWELTCRTIEDRGGFGARFRTRPRAP